MAERGQGDAEDVKRLLVLLLLKLGATSEEIGLALGVHPSRVRQIIPGRKIKKIRFTQSE